MNRRAAWMRLGMLALVISGGAVLLAIAILLLSPARAHRIAGEYVPMRFKPLLHAAGAFLAAHALAGGTTDAGPVPPTTIGVNLGGVNHASPQRAFANLAIGGTWLEAGLTPDYVALPVENQTADGGLASLPPGATAVLGLATPDTGPRGVTIGCTWAGRGTVALTRGTSGVTQTRNSLHFHWTNKWQGGPGIDFRVSAVDPQDPVRDIDCREITTPKSAFFDPAFVKSLRGFKTIRFMDWQRTNASVPLTWATRNRPSSIAYAQRDGVPVEHMLALTNELGVDPWFCMSWNADAGYVEHFAQYVHDHLPAGRRVYIENSNEVWNHAFSAAKQAIAEGLAEHLSPDPTTAGLYRYAEKTTEVMTIWTRVFADRPRSLVRVAASQHVVPAKADTILGFRDTAAHIDALATASYFGDIAPTEGSDHLDGVFALLNKQMDEAIAQAVQNKAVARKYGKTYLTYEAGQGIVMWHNVPYLAKIERDPRMYGIYRKFIAEWRGRVGGALNLFNNVGAIKFSGAWGLLEHSGQPLSEAPKMRAVVDDWNN